MIISPRCHTDALSCDPPLCSILPRLFQTRNSPVAQFFDRRALWLCNSLITKFAVAQCLSRASSVARFSGHAVLNYAVHFFSINQDRALLMACSSLFPQPLHFVLASHDRLRRNNRLCMYDRIGWQKSFKIANITTSCLVINMMFIFKRYIYHAGKM